MNIYEYKTLCLEDILEILQSQKVCQLATMGENSVNSVPMWYISGLRNNKLVFYFVCIPSGTKMRNMDETGKVCVSVLDYVRAYCKGNYNSIVVNGNASLVTDDGLKDCIIRNFIKKYGSPESMGLCFGDELEYVMVEAYQVTGRAY